MEKLIKNICDIHNNSPYANLDYDSHEADEIRKLIEQKLKQKEEVVIEIEKQLKKVVEEHQKEVSEDTYWRGVKIGLETSLELLKQ